MVQLKANFTADSIAATHSSLYISATCPYLFADPYMAIYHTADGDGVLDDES